MTKTGCVVARQARRSRRPSATRFWPVGCRSARGSSPAVASRNSSQRLAGLVGELLRHRDLDRDQQVARGAVLAGTPLPRTRKVRPFGVPGGSRSVTGGPSRVGTLTSAPSAASGKVTGTVSVRLSPVRPNTGCGVTCTVT